MTKLRRQAYVVAVLAVGAALPADASAQTPPEPSALCRPLVIPADLASEVEDVVLLENLCAGQPLRIEVEEERKVRREPDAVEREKRSEIEVRRPRRGVRAAVTEAPPPQEVDPEDLARLGYAVEQEESVEIRETPDSRSEDREETTRVRGDDFTYRSREREEEIDSPGMRSREEDSEEKFSSP